MREHTRATVPGVACDHSAPGVRAGAGSPASSVEEGGEYGEAQRSGTTRSRSLATFHVKHGTRASSPTSGSRAHSMGRSLPGRCRRAVDEGHADPDHRATSTGCETVIRRAAIRFAPACSTARKVTVTSAADPSEVLTAPSAAAVFRRLQRPRTSAHEPSTVHILEVIGSPVEDRLLIHTSGTFNPSTTVAAVRLDSQVGNANAPRRRDFATVGAMGMAQGGRGWFHRKRHQPDPEQPTGTTHASSLAAQQAQPNRSAPPAVGPSECRRQYPVEPRSTELPPTPAVVGRAPHVAAGR